MFLSVSKPATRCPPSGLPKEPIHLVTQYYVPKDDARKLEIQDTLRRNLANDAITSVTLLNERIYTSDELGLSEPSPKLTQTVIARRARFADLLSPPALDGFVVVANADIFFDATISRAADTDHKEAKKVFALLRYEFRSPTLSDCKLFGPRPDSQDVWIVHSTHVLPPALFQFELGAPGCDNKIAYVFELLGFEVVNDPLFIRSYHHHRTEERNYAPKRLDHPYHLVYPARIPSTFSKTDLDTYNLRTGNARLAAYIASKGDDPFVIPRIAGIENNVAVEVKTERRVMEAPIFHYLKRNAGVGFQTIEEVNRYSDAYLAAFQKCEIYASWEPWAEYTKHIQKSQHFMQTRFKKPQFAAYTFDVFQFVADGNPWTRALRGKKLLIISPFVDQIKAQPKTVYPVDLFPECTFVYLKPPMTQAAESTRGWDAEFGDFCEQVKGLEFDVALCSCGGYGNPICGFIFSLGKSAIYVGGVLQMYFGIYGHRWLVERPEVMKLYLTNEWVRPSERPKGYKEVENGCYW